MHKMLPQPGLFDDETENPLHRDDARHALDELFNLAGAYRQSAEYHALIQFVGEFHWYAPYNAMLVHVQMPGSTFVARPEVWRWQYLRTIKPGARPLVMLRPMGPVMFVFDVSQTEALAGAPPLPQEAVNPFQARGLGAHDLLLCTTFNAIRDGVKTVAAEAGSSSAGSIQPSNEWGWLRYVVHKGKKVETVGVRNRYELLLNGNHDEATQFATLAHELAHLYCGHLGTPNPQWWPDRRGLTASEEEFEAESVSYIVCKRLGIVSPAERYLSGFLAEHDETPSISLDVVLRAAGLILEMATKPNLPPRKPLKEET